MLWGEVKGTLESHFTPYKYIHSRDLSSNKKAWFHYSSLEPNFITFRETPKTKNYSFF